MIHGEVDGEKNVFSVIRTVKKMEDGEFVVQVSDTSLASDNCPSRQVQDTPATSWNWSRTPDKRGPDDGPDDTPEEVQAHGRHTQLLQHSCSSGAAANMPLALDGSFQNPNCPLRCHWGVI